MIDIELTHKAGKAGIWYTVANVALKGCAFFTLPVFTHIMTTRDFGVYNAYIAYEQILQAVIGLGLYGTVKNAKLDFGKDLKKYLSSAWTMSFVTLGIVLLLCNLLYNRLSSLLGFSQTLTNCLILQSFGAYLIYFYEAKLNIEFKYKSYIAISCFNTLINIGASVVLILYVFPNERYIGRIIGSAVPLILLAIIISIHILINGKTLYNGTYWKYALSIGLPLVPHVVSQSLLSQFDRIMIRDMVGSNEAGIYSFVYILCTITFVISSSFDNAWTPWVYMKIKGEETEDIYRAGTQYVLLFAGLTLGFICIMPEVIRFFAGSEYWIGINLLVPLALANYFVFLYTLPVGVEYYNKKTKYISYGTVMAALLNLTLNYIAIRIFGYEAAAYTTLISYVLLFMLHYFLSKKLGFLEYYNIREIVFITCVLVLLSILIQFVYQSLVGLIIRYTVILLILFAGWTKRSILRQIIGRK